ncbi:MAG: lactonase family protein [Acidobacteriaceae bacterium]|nr:lactonase family protein [Acidobacteriaceae bacterium]
MRYKFAGAFAGALIIAVMSASDLPAAENAAKTTLGTDAAANAARNDYFVYVGVYGKGIYGYRFHAADAKLEPMGLVGPVANPSFLATDREFKYLYAVSELDGKVIGGVAGFAIDRKNGSLEPLNSVPSAGEAPCHLAVDHTGKVLIVANYGTGGVSSYGIEKDGHLKMSSLMDVTGSGADPERQAGPHAHQVVISSDNNLAYVPDLGLDKIRIYKIDPRNAKLEPHSPAFVQDDAGFGPRHIVFSHDGKYLYVINELKSFVTVFAGDEATGVFHQVQKAPTVPEDYNGQNDGPAEILLDRAGKFLYSSNRGPGTIVVFAVDPANGTLKQVESVQTGGTFPRGVELDPTGGYLFVGDQKTNRFILFRVDPETGRLTQTGEPVTVPSPVAFQFVPAS